LLARAARSRWPGARHVADEQFLIRVAQGTAAMASSLGGVGALVVSGEIGTHAPIMRQRVADLLAWTGLRIDPECNIAGADRVEAENSRAKIWSLAIDEEKESHPWLSGLMRSPALGPAALQRAQGLKRE